MARLRLSRLATPNFDRSILFFPLSLPAFCQILISSLLDFSGSRGFDKKPPPLSRCSYLVEIQAETLIPSLFSFDFINLGILFPFDVLGEFKIEGGFDLS